MDTALISLIVIVALALAFDFINGFHDTANAIATSVATRVLTPAQAIAMSAILNVVGALMGTHVAKTVSKDIVSQEYATLELVGAALVSAIAWNLFTWWKGLPSSSSHALIFSLVGAGVAAGGGVLAMLGRDPHQVHVGAGVEAAADLQAGGSGLAVDEDARHAGLPCPPRGLAARCRAGNERRARCTIPTSW